MMKQDSFVTGLTTASIILLSSPAAADESTIVNQIWQRYLENCGQILGATDTVLSDFPLSEPGFVLAKSNGGTRLTYGWASDDYTRSSSVEMGIAPDTISTICSVGRSGIPAGFDALKASEILRQMVAEEPSLSMDGGLMNFEAGSPQSIRNFTSDGKFYSFNIYGAFDQTEITSTLDVSSDNITVFHMVSETRTVE